MNLSGVTYSFGSFGIHINILYGLLPLCRIAKKRITRVYVQKASGSFSDALGRGFGGWQLGNRFTRTVLVVETNLLFFRRLYLTPRDPQAVIELLSAGGRTFSVHAPGLTTRSSEQAGR